MGRRPERLVLTEGGPAVAAEFTAAQAAAIEARGLAAIARTADPGTWELTAGRKVGVAHVGGLDLVVRPKIEMRRLVSLMGYAWRRDHWTTDDVHLDPEHELPEALADAFARLATRALDHGLLHGYVAVDDALPVVRGRVRTGDQIRRRLGVGLPLEVAYDEFSVDIAENRLLLGATLRTLRMPTLPSRVRRQLLRLRLQLSDVTRPGRGAALPAWQPSRLGARYHPALTLAELILRADSFEQRVGDVVVSGFVFDMWQVFEDFVCHALDDILRRTTGAAASLQHRAHLDAGSRVPIRPDLCWPAHGAPRLVIDAKYKAERPAGFPQADLYQMLAYCTVFGLRDGHLIYAKGEEPETVHNIVGAGVRIHCHSVDLSLPPERLLDQLANLATRISANATDGPIRIGTDVAAAARRRDLREHAFALERGR